MKQPIRYFSIGLFTASLISLLTFIFYDQPNTNIDQSIDELITEIENEGYHVLTESEYISFSVNKENNAESTENDVTDNNSDDVDEEKNQGKETEKEDEENQEDDKDNSEDVKTYTLVVEPNMLGPTISNLLYEHDIIDDAEEFNRYLEVEGYAPYIQLGEHKLSSDMSHFEIAETIAKTR